MQYVFVNNALETFTADGSGAIATHVAAVRQAAQRDGVLPLVITRADRVRRPLDEGPRLDVRAAPQLPRQLARVLDKVSRNQGWQSFAGRYHGAQVRRRLARLPRSETRRALVLHNDPDVADALARAFPDDRIVHVFHNVLPHGRSRDPRVRHLAVSSYLAGAVKDLAGGTPPSVAPNGVDSGAFRPGNSVAGKPTISFLGRTGREKGPDLLLEALLRLDCVAGLRLLLIGSNTWTGFIPDDYQRSLADRLAELTRRGMTVVQPGHVGRAEVAALLRTSTIHVVPSRWEDPAPLVLMEAMASGLATVAARSGGMPEYGADTCLWFEREDVAGLVHHLKRLLADRGLSDDLGRRARLRAEALTWDATWAAIRRVAEAES